MNMNRPPVSSQDHFRSLQILEELSRDDSLTQRDLSGRIGIALGLVNSYLKNLIAKGYITVKTIPPKRYTYYLTPKGFSEKTRLTYHLLQDYTRIYREAKSSLRILFKEMSSTGVRKVVFAGSDEVSEIAYITLQETGLELTGVVDRQNGGKRFFGMEIKPLGALSNMKYDRVIVASYLHRETLFQELLKQGVAKRDIHAIFAFKPYEQSI